MNALGAVPSRGSIVVRALFYLAVFFALLATTWMILLPSAVTRFVRKRTGFGVEIRSLYVNPFTANVDLQGLVMTNPPAFPRQDFVEVREFRANARLFSLFSQQVVIDDAILNVADVSIVKDRNGLVNTSAFQSGLLGPPASQRPVGPERPADVKHLERQYLIKRLQVRFDRLTIADYSKHRPDVREFALNFSHTYVNVTSTRQLAAPLADVVNPIAGAIGNLLPESGAALRTIGDTVKETGRKAGDTVKGFFQTLEKTLKK